MTTEDGLPILEPPQEQSEAGPSQNAEATPIGIQITPQGVTFSFPMHLSLEDTAMTQLVKQYLQAHPELVQEIAKEAIAQKQMELKFIEMVRRSKIHD